MRDKITTSGPTYSMVCVTVDHNDLDLTPQMRTHIRIGLEKPYQQWRIMHEQNGVSSIQLRLNSEAEADAVMDGIAENEAAFQKILRGE